MDIDCSCCYIYGALLASVRIPEISTKGTGMRSRLTRLLAPIVIAIAAAVTLAAPAQAAEAGPSAEVAQNPTGCNARPEESPVFCYYAENYWGAFIGENALGISVLPAGISSLRNRTDQWWCVYTGTYFTGNVRAVHGYWEEGVGNYNNVPAVSAWGSGWDNNIRSARPMAVC